MKKKKHEKIVPITCEFKNINKKKETFPAQPLHQSKY